MSLSARRGPPGTLPMAHPSLGTPPGRQRERSPDSWRRPPPLEATQGERPAPPSDERNWWRRPAVPTDLSVSPSEPVRLPFSLPFDFVPLKSNRKVAGVAAPRCRPNCQSRPAGWYGCLCFFRSVISLQHGYKGNWWRHSAMLTDLSSSELVRVSSYQNVHQPQAYYEAGS